MAFFSDNSADAQILKYANDPRHTYYMTALSIDACADHTQYDSAAQQIIAFVNGLARARNSSYRPVRLAHRYTDENGQNYVFG
jgi:hypothetical protein